jgi:hypothetical protein
MEKRTCVYTGKEAKAKDRPILSDDERHNWSNRAPISLEYLPLRSSSLPTALEMEAVETFYNLEIAKLRVAYFDARLSEIQKELSKNLPEPNVGPHNSKPKVDPHNSKPNVGPHNSKQKEREIVAAIHEKEVIQEAEKDIEEMLKDNMKKMWG